VRTPKKGEFLKSLFAKEATENSHFDYIVIQDIQTEDAFDDAVKGVDAVEHIASAVFFPEGDPELVLGPAIKGTVGILNSVKKHGHAVRRVVITSSMAAVGPDDASGLADADWNQPSVDEVRAKGINASPRSKYNASKVLAERGAWEFAKLNAGKIAFDIVTICPPWIFGPTIHGGISLSNQFLLVNLEPKNRKTGTELTALVGSYSDVRDIAALHVDLLLEPEAGGHRFIATADPFSWKDIYEALDIPLKKSASSSRPASLPSMDNSKLAVVLRRPLREIFRPLAETLRDAARSAREKGWRAPINLRATL